MQVKLDENLGKRGRQLLVNAGHDVATVAEQGLTSASDAQLIEVCRQESRCFVTLDLDFANPFVFPPEDFEGIVVIRLPGQFSLDDLHSAVATLLAALDQESIIGRLWIVERHRIREYLPEEDMDSDGSSDSGD